MSNEIEHRYGKQGLHGLSLVPGGIRTPLQRHIPAERMAEMQKGNGWFMKSVEQGAATQVWAALAKEPEGAGGKYLEDCSEALPVAKDDTSWLYGYAAHAFDSASEKRLWNDSMEMTDTA